MIFDLNEENLNLLARTRCPVNLRLDGHCMLDDNKAYALIHNCSAVDFCRACWLKWLSKENKGV